MLYVKTAGVLVVVMRIPVAVYIVRVALYSYLIIWTRTNWLICCCGLPAIVDVVVCDIVAN